MKRKTNWLAWLILAAASLQATPAWACAACFGESDSPLATGASAGILFLLVVVAGVLGSIGTFFVFLARRAAAASSAGSDTNSEAPRPPDQSP